jgi:hypothetical protein
LSLRIATPEGIVRCNVTVADTSLLTAAKTSLEKLGDDLGLPKVKLPAGYSKDRMDLVLAERRDEFIRYAMTDARISALWAMRVDGIMKSLGVKEPIPTLGAASVRLVEQELVQLKIDQYKFLGKDKTNRGKRRSCRTWWTPGRTQDRPITAALTPPSPLVFRPRAANWSTSISSPPTRRRSRSSEFPTGAPRAGRRTSLISPLSTRR